MEKEKATINVLACCATRDSLDFMQDKCTVLKYNAFVSPWSMLTGEKVSVSSDKLLEAYKMSPFRIRCIQNDAQLSTIDFLKECKSEWFILDLADARLGLNVWKEKNVVMTRSQGFIRVANAFEETLGTNYEIVNPWELPEEEIWGRLDRVLDSILEMYRPEQIIYNEVYGVNFYVNKNHCIRQWNKNYTAYIDDYNAFLKRVYEYTCSRLQGCHIIRFPENALPYEGNRWGLHEMHFHSLYFEYIGKAISVILERPDKNVEDKELAALWELYSQKFATLKAEARYNTLQEDNAKELENFRADTSILSSEVKTLNAQLAAVRNSRSYKIGRMVTWVPRKIRDAFKKKGK